MADAASIGFRRLNTGKLTHTLAGTLMPPHSSNHWADSWTHDMTVNSRFAQGTPCQPFRHIEISRPVR